MRWSGSDSEEAIAPHLAWCAVTVAQTNACDLYPCPTLPITVDRGASVATLSQHFRWFYSRTWMARVTGARLVHLFVVSMAVNQGALTVLLMIGIAGAQPTGNPSTRTDTVSYCTMQSPRDAIVDILQLSSEYDYGCASFVVSLVNPP